jgi:hypothetical protein
MHARLEAIHIHLGNFIGDIGFKWQSTLSGGIGFCLRYLYSANDEATYLRSRVLLQLIDD